MRNLFAIGLAVVLAFTLMSAGTILAGVGTEVDSSAPWLGVRYLESDAGLEVVRMRADSPASVGGLLIGDVLISFDGEAVQSGAALANMVAAHAPDDVVEVVVMRNGVEQSFLVTLGSQADHQAGCGSQQYQGSEAPDHSGAVGSGKA